MSHPDHNGSSSPSDTREQPSSTPEQIDTTSAPIPQGAFLTSSYVSLNNNDANSPSSVASSTYSASDVDSPIMTKASLPRKSTSNNANNTTNKSNNNRGSTPSSHEKSGSTHKHGWPNGKRPRGFRTKEGKEAAEKSKNYKTGVSIPHLSARCNTFEGVLKHSILGAIRKCGFICRVERSLDAQLICGFCLNRSNNVVIERRSIIDSYSVLFPPLNPCRIRRSQLWIEGHGQPLFGHAQVDEGKVCVTKTDSHPMYKNDPAASIDQHK